MEHAAPGLMPNDVLVVEDDPIIALDFEDRILGFGVKTVRSASSVAKALQMIAGRVPEFALLNVGLLRENSFAVAERLEALGIPFAFVTGYGADVRLPPAFAHRPRLPKPCSAAALHGCLAVARAPDIGVTAIGDVSSLSAAGLPDNGLGVAGLSEPGIQRGRP